MDSSDEPVTVSIGLLLKLILSNWKRILLVSMSFGVLAVLLSFLWPKEYESDIFLLPESNSNSFDLASLSGLAGLAGINMGNFEGTDGISVKVYEKIVSSSELNYSILYSYLQNGKINDSISVKEYLRELRRSPTQKIKGILESLRALARARSSTEDAVDPSELNFLKLTPEDYSLIEELRDRISISHNPLDGAFHITVKMQNQFFAAQILDMVILKLERKLTEYKTNKEMHNALFIKERMEEAEIKLEMRMNELASFIDRNQNKTNQTLILQEDFLRSKYNLASEIYSSMASQYAQSLIKIEESRPEFVFLDAIKIPIKRSSPKRVLTGMISFLIGCIFSTVMLIVLNYKELIT